MSSWTRRALWAGGVPSQRSLPWPDVLVRQNTERKAPREQGIFLSPCLALKLSSRRSWRFMTSRRVAGVLETCRTHNWLFSVHSRGGARVEDIFSLSSLLVFYWELVLASAFLWFVLLTKVGLLYLTRLCPLLEAMILVALLDVGTTQKLTRIWYNLKRSCCLHIKIINVYYAFVLIILKTKKIFIYSVKVDSFRFLYIIYNMSTTRTVFICTDFLYYYLFL